MIILNQIQTPDGTILTSHHRHDFVGHTDANGKFYAVDGGRDYLKRIGEGYIELSIDDSAPFELIRKNLYRLNSLDGNTPTLLCDMSLEWLKNVVTYNKERGYDYKFYEQEIKYRNELHNNG